MYKSFDPTKDIVYSDREVYTYVPISGNCIQSGTTSNAKTFWRFYANQVYSGSSSGSFFATIYDQVKTVTTATELFDVTYGISISSSFHNDYTVVKSAKNRIYKHFAELCWGSPDERFSINSTYYDELIFLHFKRNLIHDEIRKGYMNIYTYYANANGTGSIDKYQITDINGRTTWREAEGGTYQHLTAASGNAGWIFYDLGLIILTPTGAFGFNPSEDVDMGYKDFSGTATYSSTVAGNIVDNIVASALNKIDVNNYTHPIQIYSEQTMQSAQYFCELGPKDFNYSSNSTFVDSEGKIILSSGSKPTKSSTYVTTIGLYGDSNELLGVAKLSEPLKKSADNAEIIRVRLNY